MMSDRHAIRRLVAAGALVLAFAQGSSAQSPEAPPRGNAIAGQQLYFDHACYSCHGYTGETGVRSLIGSGFVQTEEIFRTYLRLRADQNPTLPSTQMPNYSEASLGDAEVSDLYAYIRTFVSNAPALEDIAVLNAIVEAAAASEQSKPPR